MDSATHHRLRRVVRDVLRGEATADDLRAGHAQHVREIRAALADPDPATVRARLRAWLEPPDRYMPALAAALAAPVEVLDLDVPDRTAQAP